jgi:beta-ureidopropionase / N-carbamoyl-L-amino-acid hydrolase
MDAPALALKNYVDGDRLWERLMSLAQYGALPGGGVNRQALSREEIAARVEIVRWARDIGLTVTTDAATNLFLRLPGRDDSAPPVLVGSHIDSQPTGGKFDGAYGFLAALEAVHAIRDARITPRRHIDVVAWMNEEGSRFAPGMMGSAVFSGARQIADIYPLKDTAGVTVKAAIEHVLAGPPSLPLRPLGWKPYVFLEAHIEQGPVLELEHKIIGVVSGIQGKRTFRVEVLGEENHAGTSPRAARRDALVAAINIVQALQDALWDKDDIVRFTVGMFSVSPNAPSVVPAQVTFSIDLRHPETAALTHLGDLIAPLCEQHRLNCEVTIRELLHDPPLDFPEQIREKLTRIANALGLPNMQISSGAGHDARHLHYICPTAMIFIPCKDGISHNEAESIEKEHATSGARVLAEAVLALANAE